MSKILEASYIRSTFVYAHRHKKEYIFLKFYLCGGGDGGGHSIRRIYLLSSVFQT